MLLTGCFSPDLCLRVLLRGFAALQALKKPGDEPGALRVSRMKVNITSLILLALTQHFPGPSLEEPRDGGSSSEDPHASLSPTSLPMEPMLQALVAALALLLIKHDI